MELHWGMCMGHCLFQVVVIPHPVHLPETRVEVGVT